MVGQTGGKSTREKPLPSKSPRQLGGANTQMLFLYVDDVDAHRDRAVAAGAVIYQDLENHDYGPEYWADRGYGVTDLEGHQWWFSQRMRSPHGG